MAAQEVKGQKLEEEQLHTSDRKMKCRGEILVEGFFKLMLSDVTLIQPLQLLTCLCHQCKSEVYCAHVCSLSILLNRLYAPS